MRKDCRLWPELPGASDPRAWEVVGDSRSRERAVDALARRQHGVVARRQLLRAGLGRHWIDGRVKAGRLRRMHRGVYVVGPIDRPVGPEMAAVLAMRRGRRTEPSSAATLWRLLRHPAHDRAVDVTVPIRRRQRTPWHPRPPSRVACRPTRRPSSSGIPITTPARTLLDLARGDVPRDLEQAVAEAERRHLASRSGLAALLARYPSTPGHPRAAGPGGDASAPGPHPFRGRGASPRACSGRPSFRLPTSTCVWTRTRSTSCGGRPRWWSRSTASPSTPTAPRFEADRRRDAELAARGLHRDQGDLAADRRSSRRPRWCGSGRRCARSTMRGAT